MSMEHYKSQHEETNGVRLKAAETTPISENIIYPSRKQNGMIHIPQTEASICTVEKMNWGAALAFNPRYTKTISTIGKIEDLNLKDVNGMGLILDIHGTLLPYGSEDFAPEVVEKLHEIRAKMKVCVFPDNGEDHPLFTKLGIPVVKNAAPKPDWRGFERAAYHYLQMKPEQCAMVGDNLLTDGGARKTGMGMILVDPLPGDEPWSYKMSRGYGRIVKKMHDRFRKNKRQV